MTLPFPIRAGGMRASIDIFSQDLDTAKKYIIAHMRCLKYATFLGNIIVITFFQGFEKKSVKARQT